MCLRVLDERGSKSMYYLFGAGSNCYSVIGFIGESYVKAIVDNDTINKVGTKYRECPIISFEDFLLEYQNELVIISTFYCKDEVAEQLRKSGINNYMVFPRLQSSYLTADQIIYEWNMSDYDSVIYMADQTIGRILADRIAEKNANAKIYNLLDYKEDKWINLLKEAEAVFVLQDHIINSQKALLDRIGNVYFVNQKIEEIMQEKYDKLRMFHNKHQDERCFLIGNGSSLKVADLDKLKENKIITFGCNHIFEIYGETDWRPDYYVAAEGLEANESMDRICNQKIICFMKHFIGFPLEDKMYVYRYQEQDYVDILPRFSDDISKCVYRSATVMFDMFQIAAYMGFKEIYLLGVDCDYVSGSCQNYFYQSPPDTVPHRDERTKRMVQAYQSAYNYAHANEIKIYNATRGGALEVFERIDFDSLWYV